MSAAAPVQPSVPAPVPAPAPAPEAAATPQTMDAPTAQQGWQPPIAQPTASTPWHGQGSAQQGWQPPAPAPAPPMSGLAIATFILGLCGFAILPVVLGHIAIGMIRRSGQRGMALAVVGTVLGYLAVAGYVALAAIVGVGILAGTAGWL